MNKRGITRIEVLVVILVVITLSAILVPFLMDSAVDHRRGPDRNNLSGLIESYLTGSSFMEPNKPTPESTGREFWLALFVGDGPGMRLEVRDVELENIYLQARSVNLLRSPADPKIVSREALEQAILEAIESGRGVAALGPTHVSYAGPKGDADGLPNRALYGGPNSRLVGSTGSRDGIGFYIDGFYAVNQDGAASFYRFSDLAEEQGYPSDASAPMYEENILEWVEDFEAAQ